MTENEFLDQTRFRIEAAERAFQHDVRALQRVQASESGLNSGETVLKTLQLLEDKFSLLTDEIIAYATRVERVVKFERATLLTLISQLLMQSRIGFEAIANKAKLLQFAAGSRVELVIDESFDRVGRRLFLRLQELSYGLDETAPNVVTARTHASGEAMSSREFRERVLIALYRKAMRDGIQEIYDANSVCKASGLQWRAGHLRAVMTALDGSGYVILTQTIGGGEDDGMRTRVTQAGIEEAEDLIEHNVEYEEDEDEGYRAATVAPMAWVPGADRYVPITDNQRAALLADAAELIELVRGDNSIAAEDRDIALYEIAVFETSIAAPRVSTTLLQRFSDGVLDWLGKIVVNAAASEVIKRLLLSLAGLA